jgi:hypothetical protein
MFPFSCSRSDTSPVHPQTAAAQTTDIAGLGKVLTEFTVESDAFNIDVLNRSNRHLESNVSAACYTSWITEFFGRDTTKIAGKKVDETHYDLAVTVNSESGTMMWNGDVTTHFIYDAAAGTWGMNSEIVENGTKRVYQYCAPSAVIDTLIASVRCYLADAPDGAESQTLVTLVNSIEEQEKKVVAEVGPLYAAADCEKPLTPEDRSFYDSRPEVPTGF